MITVGCVYFQPNDQVQYWSSIYSPEWVNKLYRGVARNISGPFRFVCLTDRLYPELDANIVQFSLQQANWFGLMELFKLPGRVLAMGIDTVITGSLDDLATYPGQLALNRGPFDPEVPSNGAWMFNNGWWIWEKFVADTRKDECTMGGAQKLSELEWMRRRLKPHIELLDDHFPGQVVSYKGHWLTGQCEKENVRIIYFHGRKKPGEIDDEFIDAHWI